MLIYLVLATPQHQQQQQEFIPIATFEDYENQQHQASVFSSFTNVLSLNRKTPEETQHIPPSTPQNIGVNFAGQNLNPPPIPLFNPTVQHQPPPQTSTGSYNY